MVKPPLFNALDIHLAKMPGSKILDVGIGDAARALEWAEQGHDVTGITIDQEEFERADIERRSRDLGRGACNFVLLDAADIAAAYAPSQFDVVVAHNVLHQIEKPLAITVVESMQHITRTLGINAVGGYVMHPDKISNPANAKNMFRHGELARHYAAGWDVLSHREDHDTKVQVHGTKEFVSSRADLIARKR